MFINNSSLEKIANINYNNCYIVTDFDRTITSEKSENSWSILSNNKKIPYGFVSDRQKLYDKYRPIELNEMMDYNQKSELISEWFKECIELFHKYKIEKNLFDEVASDSKIMEFRVGAKKFIRFLSKKSIPLIIISAGIGNFIECFLKNNNCLYDNSYILSNKILFENGISVGVENGIIHSLNKNKISLPVELKEIISKKDIAILLGDQISDSKMLDSKQNKQLLKIGFYSKNTNVDFNLFKDNFDIICSDRDDYNDLLKLLFKY